MKTQWGRALDPGAVLQEYPRPQMVRDSYINLNGVWEYAITKEEARPLEFDGEILVPFSPESELSGVRRTLHPEEFLWYRRSFTVPPDFNRGRVLLHFGAVDQAAAVFVNGVEAGGHMGGYLPFTVDITKLIREDNTLVVRVTDDTDASFHSRGKQKTKRGGIWYTPQSGVWQTVWLESVPRNYIRDLKITPLFDEGAVELTVFANTDRVCTATIEGRKTSFRPNAPVRIPMPGFIPWTPEAPHLYDFAVWMGDDAVTSYFGMRKFSMEPDEAGTKRLFLNNRPYFQSGVLDQGYWPDGLYTAPTDTAMFADLKLVKGMGFNMVRKHIKIEPLRWYYHCDRLGLIVWQDMVNGGGRYHPVMTTMSLALGIHVRDGKRAYRAFAREDAEGRLEYQNELVETVQHLYNAPCIGMWVPFNEGWGQFDAADAAARVRALDPTRPIDHASGWHDQYAGDVSSVHTYFMEYRFRPDAFGRAVVLSEFGGYHYEEEGHLYSKASYGYKRFRSRDALMDAFEKLYEREIVPAKALGLSAAVYTQLSDVEDEVNGLVTYDRMAVKFDTKRVRALNRRLIDDGTI